MNINTAIAQANRYTRALKMKVEGYRMELATKDRYDIFRPENTSMLADYTIDRYRNTCDCPDGVKGNICKHRHFVEVELDDIANMEAQCQQWEEEEGGSVTSVIERLQCRMVQDFDKAEAQVRSKQVADTRTVADRHKRLNDLTGAINVMNSYLNEGYVSSVATEDIRF